MGGLQASWSLAAAHWEHLGGGLSRKGHAGRAWTSPNTGKEVVGEQEPATIMVAAVWRCPDEGYAWEKGGIVTAASANVVRLGGASGGCSRHKACQP